LFPRYRAFGGVIESALPFPELSRVECPETSRWRVIVAEDAPSGSGLTLLGERQLGPEWYRLWRTPSGLRLEYSHAGIFDVSRDGTEITWYRRADAIEELVRSIILGPALALSLELAGFLCLHGSAVAIDGRSVVFLGPKHHGKSTLATALTAAGARLIGDDLIAIAPGTPSMVAPGIASVRLWDDTVDALPVGAICSSVVRGIKTTASGFADRAVTDGLVPLGAIYILRPVVARDTFECERIRLSGAAAAISLAQQTKLPDSLIGTEGTGAKLAGAARLAMSADTWTLATARDMQRLPGIVAQILHWHTLPS
jgi:hypothetical protein